MSRDVEFRLTVTRDPGARSTISRWESDLSNSEQRYQRERVRQARGSETDINRLRGLAVQRELKAQRDQVAAGRAALADRLAAYKKYTAAVAEEERKQTEEAQRQARKRVFSFSRNGGPPPGGGGGLLSGGMGGFMGAAAGRLAGPVAATAATYLGGRAIMNTANAAVGSYMELESLTMRLEALTGSASEARDMLDSMRSLSIMSGTQVSTLAEAAATMKGFGVATKDVMPKLKEMSAITAGDTQRMQRLALAYAQAAGQGRLMAEELNQMIDAGFNPLMQISKNTGKSISELRDEMRDGKVSVEMMKQAFTDATSEGGQFGTMLDKMGGSLKVAQARVEAEKEQLMQRLGKELAPVMSLTLDVESLVINAGQATLDAFTGEMTQQNKKAAGMLATDSDTQLKRRLMYYETGDKKYADDMTKSDTNELGGGPNTGATFWERLGGGIDSETKAKAAVLEEMRRRSMEREQAFIEESEKAEAEKAARQKRRQEEALSMERNALLVQARQLTNVVEINKLRREGAADELKSRQRIAAEAEKEREKAANALLSARERFGAMSGEEQKAAITTLLKARSSDPSKLSLDEIKTLKNLGTGESERLASTALQRRADARFGDDGLQSRLTAVQDELSGIQGRRRELYMDKPSNRGFNPEELRKFDAINHREWQLKQQQQAIYKQAEEREAIRGSLFGDEQKNLRQARMKETRIDASVKQQIEFVAKFDQTAQQIAEQVQKQFARANQEQIKEVLKILQPLQKQVETNRRRQMAMGGGR